MVLLLLIRIAELTISNGRDERYPLFSQGLVCNCHWVMEMALAEYHDNGNVLTSVQSPETHFLGKKTYDS